MNQNFPCKCGHSAEDHKVPRLLMTFTATTGSFILDACYVGSVPKQASEIISWKWDCLCNKYVSDKLGYLEQKYEESLKK